MCFLSIYQKNGQIHVLGARSKRYLRQKTGGSISKVLKICFGNITCCISLNNKTVNKENVYEEKIPCVRH